MLCLAGWHIPSASDWLVLTSYMAGSETKLMEGCFGGNEYCHLYTSSENKGDEANHL
jgi:hypothetical protein